jgi:hypothetical protein
MPAGDASRSSMFPVVFHLPSPGGAANLFDEPAMDV